MPAAGSPLGEGHVLKCGDSHALLSPDGWIAGADDGLFSADMRFLSLYRWLADGRPLAALDVDSGDGAVLTARYASGEGSDVEVAVARTITADGWLETLDWRNRSSTRREVRLTLEAEADFSDVFAVRRLSPEHLHPGLRLLPAGGAWLAERTGLDGRRRICRLEASWPGATLAPVPGTSPNGAEDALAWRLSLAPGRSCRMRIRVAMSEAAPGGQTARSPSRGRRAAEGPCSPVERDAWVAAGTTISSDSADFDRWFLRGLRDLHLLRTAIPAGTYLSAGLPRYQAPFGRDMLVAALLVLPVRPDLAAEALRFLAAFQGRAHDPGREEQPGRILHELRRGELARAGLIPHAPYFGSIDSTPLFLWLAGEYERWTADDGLLRELDGAIRAATSWLERDADPDGDGLIEYADREGAPLTNQGWKDSHDSIVHADGRPAVGPIALGEAQAYACAAERALARLARVRGEPGQADGLESAAERRKARIRDAFWQEDLGFPALALDGAKRPLRSVASNPGHALWAGAAGPEDARRLADRLLRPDLLGRWGLRTLSADSPAHDPRSYHNGSIWPHDTAIAALGLASHGLRDEAFALFGRLLDASRHFPLARLPELYAGLDEPDGPHSYPAACSPQAWAAAAPLAVVTAILAPEPDARERRLTIRPALPGWLDRLSIRNMSVGRARMDVDLRRDRAGRTHVAALNTEGGLAVRVAEPGRA